MLFILAIYFKFEESDISSKEIALIAIYSAFAAVARIPFVGIPSVQPVSFLVLCAGYVFGPLIGFIIGGNTAFLSNIFLGQGVWTIYQIFAWGFFGLLGGALGKTRNKQPDKWILALMGFLLAFLYGWFMNIWSWLLIRPISLASFIATNIQSIPFDIAHALSNFIFLIVFGEQTIRILERYQQRFFFTIKQSQDVVDVPIKEK
ncbi:MAG: ECF transporter S component [Candidatus Lokiarchaeota archaeon]|nr:ECF transporter S component [Candidatus Lokiarchaeota archaeon]